MPKKKVRTKASEIAVMLGVRRSLRQANLMAVIEQRNAQPRGIKSVTSKSSSRSSTSPLLKLLPGEIREQIWRYVVVSNSPICLRKYRDMDAPSSRLRSGKGLKIDGTTQHWYLHSTTFSLALTCRQVYLEVTPIYYGENVFHPDFRRSIESPENFDIFLDVIGKENAGRISNICFNSTQSASIGLAKKLKRLKKADIPLWYVNSRYCNGFVQFCAQRKGLVVTCNGKVVDYSVPLRV